MLFPLRVNLILWAHQTLHFAATNLGTILYADCQGLEKPIRVGILSEHIAKAKKCLQLTKLFASLNPNHIMNE